jgi:hypothetical protein
MHRLPEYRSRAASLRQQAAAAVPEHRDDFLKLADMYEQLAEQIETMAAKKQAAD